MTWVAIKMTPELARSALTALDRFMGPMSPMGGNSYRGQRFVDLEPEEREAIYKMAMQLKDSPLRLEEPVER